MNISRDLIKQIPQLSIAATAKIQPDKALHHANIKETCQFGRTKSKRIRLEHAQESRHI